MAVEFIEKGWWIFKRRYVKRTIWEAVCLKCEWSQTNLEKAREVQCPSCKEWLPFIENSYLGPELPKWKG